jgi:MFS family permease
MYIRVTRLYYGWIVVALAFITMMFVIGTFASSGVLFAALVTEYDWSRATTSLPFSIALVGYAATAWLAGRLFDRYGPRWLFPIGTICLGLGLIASAYTRTPWQLCLTWGILVGQGFNLAGFVPHSALVALWFRRHLGVAVGLAISGASIGSLTIVPAVQYLVDQIGWRSAYPLLGWVIIVALTPMNALWQRHHPADLGLYPDGLPPAAGSSDLPAVQTQTAASWTLGDALGTRSFWFLFVMAVAVGWLSNIVSVHLIAHITDNGFSSLLAASMVGLMGLFRAGSGTVWGGLSDRFGRESMYTLGSALSVVGLIGLAVLHPLSALWTLYASVLILGMGYGVHGAVEASSIADLFQGPHLGAILGALELGWGIGGFLGSWGGGFWYDMWGRYHGVFVVTIGVSTVGCIALWLAAPRHANVKSNVRRSI